MGGQNSTLSPGVSPQLTEEELRRLEQASRYNRPQIEQLHRQFMAEAPSGFVPISEFLALAEVMGITDHTIGRMMFNAFDANNDGFVSFAEFVVAMSKMTRGTPDEKTELAFSIYDSANVGYLTRASLLQLVTSLRGMLGTLSDSATNVSANPEHVVEHLFQELDENKDGRITLAEYKRGAQRNPAIVQGLALFPTR